MLPNDGVEEPAQGTEPPTEGVEALSVGTEEGEALPSASASDVVVEEAADGARLAEVRRLAADARWLDALDALEALGASEGGEDEVLEEVRARGACFRRARELCEASGGEVGEVGETSSSSSAWSEGYRAFGVETSFRYDDAGLLWLRTTGPMDDIDLFHTVAVIREIALFGEWIPFLRHSTVVREVDFSRLLAWFSIGVRGVLSRDCVLRVAACNDALSSGALYFEGASLGDDVRTWRGAAVPPRSTTWGFDRMVVRSLFAKVAFTSKTSQHCIFVVSVDLRTSLPRAVLDFFLKKLVGLFLWLWRRQSRYISTHDACKHRDAIAADPAFYETWLRPKYDEFCATRGWAGAPGPALRPDGDDGDGGAGAEPPDD